MRARLFILVILFSSSSLKAQDSTKVFRIGFTASLDKNLSSEAMAFDRYTGFSARYDKFNYRVGLNLEYNLRKGFSLNTAFNYSNKDFTGTYYCAVCNFSVLPGPEDIDFRLIEVPLSLKYYYQPGRLGVFGEAGVSNHFLLEELIDRTYSFGIRLGVGLNYNITPDVALRLFYDHTEGITNLYDESDFRMRTSGFGVGVMKSL